MRLALRAYALAQMLTGGVSLMSAGGFPVGHSFTFVIEDSSNFEVTFSVQECIHVAPFRTAGARYDTCP